MIAFTLAIWAFAELFALTDFMFIVTYRRNPKHWTRAVIRFIVITLFAGLACKFSYETAFYLAYGCALFWLIFEIRLNQRRGNSPFYIGKTAWSDKLFRSLQITGEKLFVFKIITLSFTITMLYYSKEIYNLTIQLCQLLNS
jgi:hypothetical protein